MLTMVLAVLVLFLQFQSPAFFTPAIAPGSALPENHFVAGFTEDTLAKGVVIPQVACREDASQTYALYLPSGYTAARKWPVLYAFDPGARGKIPVEHFQEAAEKYGWIVVGSNNSRNGSRQSSLDAWNAITKDTNERFAIDERRAYATGFSGGARVALFFAASCNSCLAGVIAYGAGLPAGSTPSEAFRFSIFAAAGFDDFNFPEVRALSEPLQKLGVNHRIQIFEGRHTWPPSSIGVEAIEWMEVQAIKAGRRSRDQQLVEDIWQKSLQQAHNLENSGKIYEAFWVYLGLSETFKGMRDLTEAEEKVKRLRDSRDVKDATRDEQRQITKQRELETQIQRLMSGRQSMQDATTTSSVENPGPSQRSNSQESSNELRIDPEIRLRGIVADLRKQSNRLEDSSERRVARRVLDGLYIGQFERGLGLLEAGKAYDQAIQAFRVVTEVYPDRAGGFYYLAWAYAANGDKKKALQSLRLATEKGFADVAAVSGNKAFDVLRKDPQYESTLQSIMARQP